MQDFETEEQQLEAIKRWWHENGSSILIGLAIGGLSLGGWSWYQNTQVEHSLKASDMYVSVVTQAETSGGSAFDTTTADQLVAGYADTPYAALSSLVVAQHELRTGNTEQAITRLQWVKSNAVQDEFKQLAQLRLARLLIAQNKYDEAYELLSAEHPAAFDALYEELKGDVFVARSEVEQARIAYDKAIISAANPSHWLQLKRQNLGASSLGNAKLTEPAT
ncbi:MAG: tetratricopeptide repeat protein [Gammaproteobacteria bacterium]|nr:tetratricopeptide repeat protein [Gammaproteobacteria bacterium]